MKALLLDAPADLEEFNSWAVQQRLSDGLPLIPPTAERVTRMLQGTDYDPAHVVSCVAPRRGEATVEVIAANAVMAGCAPTSMPILIATTATLEEPALSVFGAQATTHPCGLMVLVTGPVATRAGVHGGSGLFGTSFPVNATIGRAMRLILQNVGGAFPGETDKATQGTPAKFSFCFGENEEASPWEPFRVSRGFDLSHSTVTVSFAEGPQNLNDHVSSDPAGLMFLMAQSIARMGANNAYAPNGDYLVVVCPEHAELLARHGWARHDVQEYLHERARIPFGIWRRGGCYTVDGGAKYLQAADDDLQVRLTRTPDDVLVVVGGGEGRHSSWIPSFGVSRSVTMPILAPDGTPML
jgi:hypothetical protein